MCPQMVSYIGRRRDPGSRPKYPEHDVNEKVAAKVVVTEDSNADLVDVHVKEDPKALTADQPLPLEYHQPALTYNPIQVSSFPLLILLGRDVQIRYFVILGGLKLAKSLFLPF